VSEACGSVEPLVGHLPLLYRQQKPLSWPLQGRRLVIGMVASIPDYIPKILGVNLGNHSADESS
jgi:hypothetical protein